jgi:hypothetical protein
VSNFYDANVVELCCHHEGGWPLCGLVVPAGERRLKFFQMSAHVEFYEAPEQEGDHQDETEGFDALRFFQEDGVDDYGIFEETEVVLDAVLILVNL